MRTLLIDEIPQQFRDEFWSRCIKGPGCWELRSRSCAKNPRPNIFVAGKTFPASWAAYVMVNGPIPRGLIILHKCDNSNCVRPSHLEAGTYSKNTQDAHDRGRFPKRMRRKSICSPADKPLKIAVELNAREFKRFQLIAQKLELGTNASVVRAAIRHLAQKLGLEQERP